MKCDETPASSKHSMQISSERKSDRNANYAILIFVIQIELKIEIEIYHIAMLIIASLPYRWKFPLRENRQFINK